MTATETPATFTIPAGTKVWPVKRVTFKDSDKGYWCVKPVTLVRDFTTTTLVDLPESDKFTKFADLNLDGKWLFMIARFPTPIHDKGDKEHVVTIGFVVDAHRAGLRPPKVSIPATEHSLLTAIIPPNGSYKVSHQSSYAPTSVNSVKGPNGT